MNSYCNQLDKLLFCFLIKFFREMYRSQLCLNNSLTAPALCNVLMFSFQGEQGPRGFPGAAVSAQKVSCSLVFTHGFGPLSVQICRLLFSLICLYFFLSTFI